MEGTYFDWYFQRLEIARFSFVWREVKGHQYILTPNISRRGWRDLIRKEEKKEGRGCGGCVSGVVEATSYP